MAVTGFFFKNVSFITIDRQVSIHLWLTHFVKNNQLSMKGKEKLFKCTYDYTVFFFIIIIAYVKDVKLISAEFDLHQRPCYDVFQYLLKLTWVSFICVYPSTQFIFRSWNKMIMNQKMVQKLQFDRFMKIV